MQPLIYDSTAEDLFIGIFSAQDFESYTSYAMLRDISTSAGAEILFIDDIVLSSPYLLEYSDYTFIISGLGVNMNNPTHYIDMTVIFPLRTFFFD